MRLICGILQLDGAEAPDERLRAMIAQMDVPRLRPAVTLSREGPIGLAVLDFSGRGRIATGLPEQGASVIAADVRLDDVATTAQDMSLLATLEKYGPSGLDSVLGDFAFARWNRTTQRLTCGRDAFGIRPFAYVYRPGKFFAFASLPKALHGSGVVPKKIDEDALARRVTFAMRFDDGLIAGIKRLPPAHFLEVSREGLSLTRYWRLDRAAIGSRKISPEDASRELRRLVDEAVQCRLPRTGEIGAHLSGGLDSSAISVLAARRLRADGRTLHAYSFLDRQRNDIQLEDETEFVKAVVEQEGDIDWTPIRPTAAFMDLGEPIDADKMTDLGADDPENAVCARAEQQGVGIILSGWGGDEGATFNGRGAFAELSLRGRWRVLAREVSALRRERRWSLARILYAEIASYIIPQSMIDFAKRIVGKDAGLETEFPRSLTSAARKRLAVSGEEGLSMVSDGRENRWRLMTSPHIAETVETLAQTGARNGVAFAFPLLDRRVVEFALSLPSALFLRGGFRRRLFRDAMTGVLPENVRLRHAKYQSFPSSIIDLVEGKNELLARVDRYAHNKTVCGLIDLGHLRRQIETFPSPEQLREEMRDGGNPAAAAAIIATMNGLRAAEYLDQHGVNAAAPESPV